MTNRAGEACASVSTGPHVDGNTRMAKALNITGNRSVGDAEPVTQFAERDTLTTSVQHLDELLMSLHTAQHQMVVARGGWSDHTGDTKPLPKYDTGVS